MPRYRCTRCKEEFDVTRPVPYPRVGSPTIKHWCDLVNLNKFWSEAELGKPGKIGVAELITEDTRTDEEKALIQRIELLLGYVPVGTLDLLHILTHPDAIEVTQQYVDSTKNKIFNEKTLRNEIINIWGPAGAHIDVFDSMINELEKLRYSEFK